jgi:hypothetical protein
MTLIEWITVAVLAGGAAAILILIVQAWRITRSRRRTRHAAR